MKTSLKQGECSQGPTDIGVTSKKPQQNTECSQNPVEDSVTYKKPQPKSAKDNMKPSLASGGVLQSPLANSMTNKNLKYFKVSPRERWSFTESIRQQRDFQEAPATF